MRICGCYSTSSSNGLTVQIVKWESGTIKANQHGKKCLISIFIHANLNQGNMQYKISNHMIQYSHSGNVKSQFNDIPINRYCPDHQHAPLSHEVGDAVLVSFMCQLSSRLATG